MFMCSLLRQCRVAKLNDKISQDCGRGETRRQCCGSGSESGSVGSESGSVGSESGSVGSEPGSVGSVCFLGLLDLDPDPLIISMDPDPDPSVTKQKE